MERPERPLLAHLKGIGCALLLLNAAAAGYALLLGWRAVGFPFALVLFAWGSLLVSGGIVGALFLNLLYVGLCRLIAYARRRCFRERRSTHGRAVNRRGHA